MKKLVMMALACTAFTGMSVSAATLTLQGGIDGSLNSDWTANSPYTDPLVIGSPIKLFSSTQAFEDGVHLVGTSDLQYTYLGTEAANTNYSSLFGNVFNSKTAAAGTSVTVLGASSGLLDFYFETLGETTSAGKFVNGATNNLAGLSLAVFVESSTSMILLFGDGLGDSDYDDMMIRVSAVPLPAAFWLFGSGLVGLFGMRKRAKAKLA
jgi:hypothetical protein